MAENTENTETLDPTAENPTPSSTEVTDPPTVTSVFDEARASVVAEFQPQLDAVNAENETLRATVAQYKELLKGTHRTEGGQSDVPTYKTEKWGVSWHPRKDTNGKS